MFSPSTLIFEFYFTISNRTLSLSILMLPRISNFQIAIILSQFLISALPGCNNRPDAE
jgi:hypothetical protein